MISEKTGVSMGEQRLEYGFLEDDSVDANEKFCFWRLHSIHSGRGRHYKLNR